MTNRVARAAIFVSMLVGGVFAADPVVSVRDSERLRAKLEQISKRNISGGTVPARTPITETELNAYLRYEMSDRIPAGVTEPWVSLLENSRVAGTATVDLSRVAAGRKSGGMLDPFNYLTGSLPVGVNGTFTATNGVGTFALESASISGVPVPTWILQEIVTSYSKSASNPQGYSIDKPFPLPSGIREIQVARGQAIVVQ